MAPTVPPNHDLALSHNPTNPPPQPPAQLQPGIPAPQFSIQDLDATQLMHFIRNLQAQGLANKPAEAGSLKEDAAQALSNLAQAPFQASGQHPYPGMEPGPSSHPRGPPNLGQLSALATSAPPAPAPPPGQPQELEEPNEDDHHDQAAGVASVDKTSGSVSASGPATRRGGRSATMGSDEWSRQRKDNHKEVERRRRGNINEGINELGRIVPNGSGEKAKGAILARAVQYIHHLKENEARNIEKWTLEKLLMDQAMGDLQTQLEELKKAWENESLQRMRLEQELEQLRTQHAALLATGVTSGSAQNSLSPTQQKQQPANTSGTRTDGESLKRNGEAVTDGEPTEKDGKRQRTE